jgi:hypothetical protein
MHGGEHGAEGREVAARAQLQEFEYQIGACARGALCNRLRRAAAGVAQRAKAVGFGGESVGKARLAQLEEHGATLALRAVAAVDAAAADGLGVRDAELREIHPEVRRVLARLRRSTRMPMNARSNLLRQETLACSRSATRMRRTREGAAAVTVALRCWSLTER